MGYLRWMTINNQKILLTAINKLFTVSKALKILMISTDRNIFLEESNACVRMREYASLVEELHIVVFTKKKSGFKELQIAQNVRIYPTNSFSRWFYVQDAYFLAKRLFVTGEEKSNINLVTTQDPFETGLAGFFISRLIRRPLHVQVHTDLFSPAFRRESFLNFFRVKIAKFLFCRGGDIRVVSQRIKKSIFSEMRFAFGCTPRVTVLPIFTDTQKFIMTPPTFNLHEKYSGFDFLILVVARLEKEKNVLRAIRLIEEISKDELNLSVGLVIVGSGSQESMLQKYANQAGISDNVFFCGWQKDDLVSYYKTADALLVTSQYEGYGRMFIEATASGCPVVTYNVGVAKEFLSFRNAIICSEQDNGCLLRNIKNLASDHVLRETLLATARNEVGRMKFQTKENYLSKYKRMWEDASESFL